MSFTVPEEQKFDWDNLSVGNVQLDHSQKFFSKQHYEHERIDQIEFLHQKMAELADSAEDKENVAKSSPAQHNEHKSIDQMEFLQKRMVETVLNDTVEDEDVKKKELEMKSSSTHCSSVLKTKEKGCTKSPGEVNKKLPIANLAFEWSTTKPKVVVSTGAVPKEMPPPPNAYLVKDIYRRKREEAERRRAEEERKLREFRSQPAPSFNTPECLKRRPIHAVTIPITPQVLKESRKTEEKRRKKQEEWKVKNQPPKFEARLPTVLKEKPFIPAKRPLVLQQCPFNLQTEKRLQERRHYDEIKRKSWEEKRKQVETEEEERQRIEKERIRELRKATTFKARPNPFKNQ